MKILITGSKGQLGNTLCELLKTQRNSLGSIPEIYKGCEVTAVKINSAKGRWGSCSGKNSLNFSWRTVLASDDAIDYVVVHELAHTIEHNHSSRFWNIVEKTLPDYRRRESEFKALSDRLARENWE